MSASSYRREHQLVLKFTARIHGSPDTLGACMQPQRTKLKFLFPSEFWYTCSRGERRISLHHIGDGQNHKQGYNYLWFIVTRFWHISFVYVHNFGIDIYKLIYICKYIWGPQMDLSNHDCVSPSQNTCWAIENNKRSLHHLIYFDELICQNNSL